MSDVTIPMAFSCGTRRTLPAPCCQSSADLDRELERRHLARVEHAPQGGHRVLVVRQALDLLDLLNVSPALRETDEPPRIRRVTQEAKLEVRIVEREAVRTLLPAFRELVLPPLLGRPRSQRADHRTSLSAYGV